MIISPESVIVFTRGKMLEYIFMRGLAGRSRSNKEKLNRASLEMETIINEFERLRLVVMYLEAFERALEQQNREH